MKVKIGIFVFYLITSTILLACPLCTTTSGLEVRSMIFQHHFLFNLLILCLPFILFIIITCMIHYVIPNNHRPLIAAGFILGVGMGGFIDGILFHQILQIHNMLSNIIFPDTLVKADVNMFWDGLFHAFNWIMVLIGIVLLWGTIKNSSVPKSNRVLMGSMITGFGTFNLTEGIIDHHLFKLHHVVQLALYPVQLYWDLAFLASGMILILGGYYLIQQDYPDQKQF